MHKLGTSQEPHGGWPGSASGVLIARLSYRNTPELQMVTSKRQLTIGSTISISSLGGLRKREEQGAGRAGEMDGGHFSR
jgi:hypothetical protein